MKAVSALIWWVITPIWATIALYHAFTGHDFRYDTIVMLLCLILATVTDK